MNPSLSANVTMPMPAGGTKTNRATTIATIVRNPSFELPAPGPEEIIYIYMYVLKNQNQQFDSKSFTTV